MMKGIKFVLYVSIDELIDDGLGNSIFNNFRLIQGNKIYAI